MAGSSLLMLIDDIATVLDDVAIMTKLAAKKSAGALSDDLALNVKQVQGLKADRELPVVWEVAKGSARNKLILVPAALAISALAPWAVVPLLMVGGAYLCYEGFEKVAHKFLHSRAQDEAHHRDLLAAVTTPEVDIVAFEKEKIKGAIRTDIILSGEIIVITLGTVASAPFLQQVAVLSSIAVLMTVGLYGFVAGIVKFDDGGLYLHQKTGDGIWPSAQRVTGAAILAAAPRLMKTLSVIGTAAMFLVGGEILVHGLPALHHALEAIAQRSAITPAIGGLLHTITPTFLNATVGFVAGALALIAVTIAMRIYNAIKS